MENNQTQTYIGKLLKDMRLEQGQTLRQVSLKTKINPKIIKALEDKDLASLPNKVYVLGFVRTYAKAIGFDAETAVTMMGQEFGINEKKIRAALSADDNTVESSKSPNTIIGIIVISVLILGLVIYVFKNTSSNKNTQQVDSHQEVKKDENFYTASLNNETPLIIEEAKDLALKEVQVEPKKVEVKKEIEKTKTAEVNVEKEKEKAVEEKKIEKVEESDAEKYKFSKFPEELFTYNSETPITEEILPEQFKSAISSGMQNLFINASDGDSWITYKKDDDPIKQFVLKQGKKLLIKGNDIRIFLGNTGAINVFYNNKLLNLNAKKGVKSLVFPPENAKKYLVPLFVHKNPGEVVTSEEYQADINSPKKP